jgi:hypothetical protein
LKGVKVVSQQHEALENVQVMVGKFEQLDTTNYEIGIAQALKVSKQGQEDGHLVVYQMCKSPLLPASFSTLKFRKSEQSMKELDKFAQTIHLLYDIQEAFYSNDEPLTWKVIGASLEMSPDLKTVKRVFRRSCDAYASKGWDKGTHTWKLLVGGTGAQTSAQRIHWMVVGVVEESMVNTTGSQWHVSDREHSDTLWGSQWKPYNATGFISGNENNRVGPNSQLILVLDCDDGTLSYSQQGVDFLKLKVPTNKTLIPWVHLHTNKDNFVTVSNL